MNEVTRVEKPWGYEEIWAKTEKYVGKILVIYPEKKLSKQYHERKEETIRVLQGTLKLWFEDLRPGRGFKGWLFLDPGQTFHIPVGAIHRMEALSEEVHVLEVSTPELEDVVRLEDDYGRTP